MNKPRNQKITKEEIINWFCNLYNSCYPVTHKDYPQSIFMFYDTQFIRKIKLYKISGLPITLPSKVTGICLFEQDWKNNRFYYKYDEVYYFLYKNYSTTHNNISTFIKDRLNESDKLNVLVPIYCGATVELILTIPGLSEYYKLNELMVMESTLIDSNEDGKLVNSNTNHQIPNVIRSSNFLGNNNWNEQFYGLLDDVRIWSRALSTLEIQQLYSDDTPLTGSIKGSGSFNVSCTNTVTNQTVTLPAQTAINWDCAAAGLKIAPNEAYHISIDGVKH